MEDQILLKRQKLTGNIYADITPFVNFKPLKNLVWRTEVGFDFGWSKGERFEPALTLGSWSRKSNSSSIQNNRNPGKTNEIIGFAEGYTMKIVV